MTKTAMFAMVVFGGALLVPAQDAAVTIGKVFIRTIAQASCTIVQGHA